MDFTNLNRHHFRKGYKSLLFSLLMSISNTPLHAAQAPAGYQITATDPEVAGKHHYDGLTVHREHTAIRHWQHPTNPGRPFNDTVFSEKDGPIQGHADRIVVYTEPFRTQNIFIPRDQRQNYEGLYQYRSDLGNDQKINLGPLFYRPAGVNAIFYAYLTQQRWERVDHTFVDFLVVSYKADEKVKFIEDASNSGAQILNDHLPEAGLYRLIAVDNEPNPADVPPPVLNIPGARAAALPAAIPQWTERWEKWKRLESDALLPEPVIEIRAPHGVLSIPGVGLFGLNEQQRAENDEISLLKAEKEAADRDVDRILALAGAPVGTVIITGPTGCGKTTLINLYANNPAISREREDGTGWELYFPHPLANFTVGHAGHSQTSRPAFYSDVQNRLIICDNPGDEDTNGPLQDIINAGMTYRMFHNPAGVKLLFAAEESLIKTSHGGYFINALERVVNSFEDDNVLHQLFHLMITKRINLNIQRYLISLVGNPGVVPPMPQDAKLNNKPRLVSLVQFLVDHPERVSTIAEAPTGEPDQQIPFAPDLTAARASILSGPFVANAAVKIKIREESQYLVQGLARKLNEDLVKYLRTEGAQRVMEYCLTKMENHDGTAAELRTLFTGLAGRLKGISTQGTPEKFLSVFDGVPASVGVRAIPQLFDTHVIRDIIANIRFLKTLLPHSVTFNIRDWKDALTSASSYLNTIGKIEKLATPPTFNVNGSVLEVKGIFFGTSDVVAELITRVTPTPITRIDAFALNTIFFDHAAGIVGNGNSFVMIAPFTKVNGGAQVIDLSGLPGKAQTQAAIGTAGSGATAGGAGIVGAPGNPGQNGGHFYLRVHTSGALTQLTVKTAGGKGGDGQQGGTGGTGGSGGDGTQDSLIKGTDRTYDTQRGLSGVHSPGPFQRWKDNGWERLGTCPENAQHAHSSLNGTATTYQNGSDGSSGGQGAQGGQGGLGGHDGSFIIEGVDPGQLPISQVSPAINNGNPGQVGPGGQGGSHGSKWQGELWTGLSGTYNHNGSNVACQADDCWVSVTQTRARSQIGQAAAGVGTSATAPSNPLTITPLNAGTIAQSYTTYYFEQTLEPLISPFIRVFPGL